MNLNSHILKLTGSAELSGPLDIGNRYAVGVEVAITDERKIDNEDGTFDLEYKAKLIRAQVHTKEGKTGEDGRLPVRGKITQQD